MTNLVMDESYSYCLAHSAVSALLIWQIFNLQFETFRTVSKVLRLAASALLFAVVSSLCITAVESHRLGADWPQLLILISLSCFIQRMRSSNDRIGT